MVFGANSGWLWLLPALAIAGVDWWAVHGDHPRWEEKAKPMVMVALIGACGGLGTGSIGLTLFMVSGLVFGLVGDVMLLPRVDNFIGGLAAFLVGHLAFLFGLVSIMTPGLAMGVGAIAGLILMGSLGRRVLAGVWAGPLAVPVAAYMATVAGVVVVGWGTGRWPIGVGVSLFALSDGILGLDRFVTGRSDRRVVVHILYHLGQAAIVAGVVVG